MDAEQYADQINHKYRIINSQRCNQASVHSHDFNKEHRSLAVFGGKDKVKFTDKQLNKILELSRVKNGFSKLCRFIKKIREDNIKKNYKTDEFNGSIE